MRLQGSIDRAVLVKYLAKCYARHRKRERALQRANPLVAIGDRMDAITYRSLITEVIQDTI